MTLAENIKKYRELNDLTQRQLAELLGVTVMTIQNYENNRREPKLDKLRELKKIYNITIDELIGEN